MRDWIHVEDHSKGVLLAYEKGRPGQTYCFGGRSERRNLDVVRSLCGILDEVEPRKDGRSYLEQVQFVKDRLGHDFRYSIDDTISEKELGFRRQYADFEQGLRSTVEWYRTHQEWVHSVLNKKSPTS